MESGIMYWLVLVLSIAGMPDITIENQMGSYITCSIAKQKFIDGNPPTIFVKGKEKKSHWSDIKCIKKQ